MHPPIRRLNLVQFALLADRELLARAITSVHVHHTWRPTRAEFRGLATIEAMRRFHVALGWADIAQHLTIDPDGGLWTGRNWNLPPASAKGHNGTRDAGPFMFEMVGNFDTGRDPFDGPQREAAIAVTAQVLHTFALDENTIHFHASMSGVKSCPGSGIDQQTFVDNVKHVLAGLKRQGATGATGTPNQATKTVPTAVPRTRFDRSFLIGVQVTREPDGTVPIEDETVPENLAAGEIVMTAARQTRAMAQRRHRQYLPVVPSTGARADDRSMLKPHVINLSRGELSTGGAFDTTPADIDGIVDAIRDRANGQPLDLMLHAHGGLVGENDALRYATTMRPWWIGKNVYPVFFVWETGLLEILRQYIVGPRDVWDWTTDPMLELAAKGPGTAIWASMKDSARRSSATDIGDGVPGGAYLFIGKLAALMADPAGRKLRLHAVGHSAGAIFHAHLIPALLAAGIPNIETLSLLAPAARVDLFKQQLLPVILNQRIKRHTMFTMEEEAEEQDNVWGVYRKSLLYFVSHSFEGSRRRPLIGLHKSIRKDEDLRELYGVDEDGHLRTTPSPKADLQLSFARDRPENPLTRSLTHGGFDNDPKTMASVLRRILGIPDDTGFGEADFPYPPLERAIELPLPAAPVTASTRPPAGPAIVTPGPATPAAAAGSRRALCIGIDDYPTAPLAGCVNDAETWGGVLASIGFAVSYLRDQEATREGILTAMHALVGSGRPGDVLVLQYAGHGTQMPDDDGDETDRYDEAFVPVDYQTGALLLDDDIALVLAALPAGTALTLFMDSCHSGTNSRFAPLARGVTTATTRPRWLRPTPVLVDAHRHFRAAVPAARAPEQSLPGVLHFAACQDDEFAWESGNQGDFTGAAASRLAGAVRGGQSGEDFLRAVRAAVVARGRQHPLLMPTVGQLETQPLLAPLAAVS